MDANFRARCKDRGFDDISLAPGWAYYVEESRYHAHLRARNGDKQEVRHQTSQSASSNRRVNGAAGEHLFRRAQCHCEGRHSKRRLHCIRRGSRSLRASCPGPTEWYGRSPAWREVSAVRAALRSCASSTPQSSNKFVPDKQTWTTCSSPRL